MSSASPAHPGQPSLGSLASKILIIVVIWAALVFATMHFVGNVWPKAYQVNLAEADAAKLKAEEATNPPKPEAPAAAPATASGTTATATAPAAAKAAPATPAASTPAPAASAPASSAPAAGTAAPAASATAAAGTAAPAASAPKATGEQKLPHDPSLAGYNRSALWNVAVFYSIVISTLCVGAIILQLFKYFHREEEEAAH